MANRAQFGHIRMVEGSRWPVLLRGFWRHISGLLIILFQIPNKGYYGEKNRPYYSLLVDQSVLRWSLARWSTRDTCFVGTFFQAGSDFSWQVVCLYGGGNIHGWRDLFFGLYFLHFPDIARNGNLGSIWAYLSFDGIPVTGLIEGFWKVYFRIADYPAPNLKPGKLWWEKPALLFPIEGAIVSRMGCST